MLFTLLIFTSCSSHFIDPNLSADSASKRAWVYTDNSVHIQNIYRSVMEDVLGLYKRKNYISLTTNQEPLSAELSPGEYRIDVNYMNFFLNSITQSLGGVYLDVNLVAGHKYLIKAKLIDNSSNIAFSILDQTTNKIVSGNSN